MANPLFSGKMPFMGGGGRINPQQIMKMFKGKNPQAVVQNLMQNNPRFSQIMNQVRGTVNQTGFTPEQLVRQMAKQNGMSDEELTEMYKSIRGNK